VVEVSEVVAGSMEVAEEVSTEAAEGMAVKAALES
jgi:hypothetical protein